MIKRFFKKINSCKSDEVLVMEITDVQREEYKNKVVEAIIKSLSSNTTITDLGDIGNEIGIAVGSVTCDNGEELNIWSFEKHDFIGGYNHGYSLMNGTH